MCHYWRMTPTEVRALTVAELEAFMAFMERRRLEAERPR